MFLLWGFVMQRMGGGPNALRVGKSKAKIYAADEHKVRFADVAGVDEAVEEAHEIVSFLKEPAKYTRLGAKPRPACSSSDRRARARRCSRARSRAGGRAVLQPVGSDFVEMFVGVGAARVRDLFAEAKKKAPCIIFIDELDAIGKSRGQPGMPVGGFDERENTLNQIPRRDGRLRRQVRRRADRRDQPSRGARPGAAASRTLRPSGSRGPSRPRGASRSSASTPGIDARTDVDLARMAAQTVGFVGADIANLWQRGGAARAQRRSDIAQRDFRTRWSA